MVGGWTDIAGAGRASGGRFSHVVTEKKEKEKEEEEYDQDRRRKMRGMMDHESRLHQVLHLFQDPVLKCRKQYLEQYVHLQRSLNEFVLAAVQQLLPPVSVSACLEKVELDIPQSNSKDAKADKEEQEKLVRVTRTRAKQLGENVPRRTRESTTPPRKKLKAHKDNAHHHILPASEKQEVIPLEDNPHQTPCKSGRECDNSNGVATFCETPSFGHKHHTVESSEKVVEKDSERMNSCLTSEQDAKNDSADGCCSFEFLPVTTGDHAQKTPVLSAGLRRCNALAEEDEKENRKPHVLLHHHTPKESFLSKSMKKPLQTSVQQQQKVLPENARGKMVQPAQDKKDSRFNGRPLSTKQAGRQLALDPISKMEQCDDACPTPELIAELADPNSITSSITKRGISPLVNPFLDVRSLLLQDEAVELETPKQHHVTIASEEEVLAMRSAQEEKCSKKGLMETVSLQSNATDLGTEDCPSDCILLSTAEFQALTSDVCGKGNFDKTVAPELEEKPSGIEGANGCTFQVSNLVTKANGEIPCVEIESYEISPYKGSSDEEDEEDIYDEDDDDDDAQKPIPLWARKENLMAEILRLQYMDPDTIFTAEKSCSLNDVFGTKGSKKRPDFVRRGSSGNWLSDSLTSREETEYKVSMGYALPAKIH